MVGLKVNINHYISDEPQPGIVECEMVDAHGQIWRFLEKTAVVSATAIDAKTAFPLPGVIAIEILGRGRDTVGREIVRIDTDRIWGVQSTDGATQFEVWAESLVQM